jgi:purine-nucleoside/S-methyl-5'-thioadenosine phosphorylase / adenosine deaminase
MKRFFSKYPEIYAVLSEKKDGSMKMLEDNRNNKNREDFFQKNEIKDVISADLENGTNVKIVRNNDVKIVQKADGLAADNKNISLSITVADCIPVFFFESEKKIIAIAHAGWQGIIGNIIANTVEKIESLGGKTENLKVALGPGINSCHFEIKEDVLKHFKKYKEFIIKRESKTFIDLKGILKDQLKSIGVELENIENDNECTYESEKYFSYRRDNPEVIEAMIAVIGFNK